MKRLLIITICSLLLAGCFDYVQPKETHIEVTEEHTETVPETQTEVETVTETEQITETETETEVVRETVTVYVTQGVNIREQQTKLSDRLGGAGFGESFEAYADTLEDEFVEIIYGEGTAFVYGRCLTTDYDVISEMRAEMSRRAQTEPQTEKLAIKETELAITETETDLAQVSTETETEAQTETQTEAQTTGAIYTPDYFKLHGVLNWGGSKWTYYSQRILPGEGLWIPGRHLDENGYVCDENGYICCAADLSYIPRYTVIETPLGKLGKIYDTGCAYGVIDVYTDW